MSIVIIVLLSASLVGMTGAWIFQWSDAVANQKAVIEMAKDNRRLRAKVANLEHQAIEELAKVEEERSIVSRLLGKDNREIRELKSKITTLMGEVSLLRWSSELSPEDRKAFSVDGALDPPNDLQT